MSITEELVDEVFLVLKILTELVEDSAAFCLLWITCEYETKAHLTDDCTILNKAASQLKQNLVLRRILVGCHEDAISALVNQALQ